MLTYDSGAERAIEKVIHPALRGDGMIRLDEVVKNLLLLPPNECRMVLAAGAEHLIETTNRAAFRQMSDGKAPGRDNDLTAYARPLHLVDADARALAEQEHAPAVTEWHLGRALCSWLIDRAKPPVIAHMFDFSAWIDGIGKAYGIHALPRSDADKWWCFCDTNVFIECRFFDEVDWRVELDVDSTPVLVLSPIVIREIQAIRNRRERRRQSDRARNVRTRLMRLWLSSATGLAVPIPSHPNTELLISPTEPRQIPDDLDPDVPDDRVIAGAIDFRWRHPNSKVKLVAADMDVLVKARHWGFDTFDADILRLPENE